MLASDLQAEGLHIASVDKESYLLFVFCLSLF